jgi:hypothetical protein
MVELILFGLAFAVAFGLIALGFSVVLAWFANRMFPQAYEPTLALSTSGLVPIGLLLWSLVSLAGDSCCESGSAAQGLLVMMATLGVLILLVWPLGYRINLSMIERARQ